MLWNTVNWTSSLQPRKQKMVSKDSAVARLVPHVRPPPQSPLCTAGKVQKSKHPSVLEPKKSYNIGELFLLLAVHMYLFQAIHGCLLLLLLLFLLHPAILLGHLKLPFERIREAILACDDTVLSEQHLRQLDTFAPNKKEVAR